MDVEEEPKIEKFFNSEEETHSYDVEDSLSFDEESGSFSDSSN